MSHRFRSSAVLATAIVLTASFATRTNAAPSSVPDLAPEVSSTTTVPITSPLSTSTLPTGHIASGASLPYAPGDAPTGDSKRYIVRYRDNASESEITAELGKRGAKQKKKLSRVFNGDILDLPPGQAALMLKNTSLVLWIEEDKTVSKQAQIEPSPSWGLDRIDQRTLPGNNIYSYSTTGAGVDAYVVDSGIMTSHSQFAGRIRSGFDVFGETANDCNGHGTHVAGTIAGATFGVAPKASLVAVKALDCAGSGSVSGVIAAIDWVVGDHTTRPAIMNLSLGTTKSPSLESAIDRAYSDGITVIVAAGNSNIDACTTSPAGNRASALTVGASNEVDGRASFSNFGSCLDLFAPGTNIVSAGISTTTATAIMSGTSMAGPHVAGLAARYLSSAPTAAPAAVMSAMVNTATPNIVANAGTLSPTLLAYGDPEATAPATPPEVTIPSATTNQPTTTGPNTGTSSSPGVSVPPGSGTSSSPSVPSEVGELVAAGGANSVWLSWFSAANGGSPLTSHVVRVFRKGVLVKTVVVDSDALHIISDLREGSTHTFAVAAVNGVGAGPFSPISNGAIPLKNVGKYSRSDASSDLSAAPNAPTRVRATSPSARTFAVRWTPPTNAKATSYEVWVYQKQVPVAKVIAMSSGGVKLYGLRSGRYALRVRAINTAGESSLSRSVIVRIR